MNIRINELVDSRNTVNKWMERFGVRFGVYKHGIFNEQLFPFDSIPRIISSDDWAYLEKGLRQRVTALNNEGKDGQWYVLEDNLRIPSGASYPMIAREITRKVSPQTFTQNAVAENRDYARLLATMMEEMNGGRGISVILTPGRYNSAYFEHSYFAEKTGATLAYPGDLFVEDNKVYYAGIYKEKTRVGCIYRRVSDEYMDPLLFEASSLLGIPNVMQAYKAGNVALINAIGNGVADDKGIYYFVPKMVEYYLDEQPILQNAPTYLPYFEKDRNYVMENIRRLVIKDVSEAGGYGVVFGKDLAEKELADLTKLVRSEPRRWIAQEVIDFKDLEILEGDQTVWRKADLRAFVVSGKAVKVWKSGLTRFSRNPNSFVVNSSQGGGFKDTWVMEA